jgi:hypothetical protein
MVVLFARGDGDDGHFGAEAGDEAGGGPAGRKGEDRLGVGAIGSFDGGEGDGRGDYSI